MACHSLFTLTVRYLFLFFFYTSHVYGTPVAAASSSSSAISDVGSPNPAPEIVCDKDLGGPHYAIPKLRDCERAIGQIPRDPRGQPVDRRFFVVPTDRSLTLPDVATPIHKRSGTCTIQVLIATEFWTVHEAFDTATWMDIWGPARLIMQQCVAVKGLGGITTRLGRNGMIDMVLYDEGSVYGLNKVIEHSTDPVAKSIALNLFLDLLELQKHSPPDAPSVLLQLAANSTNATATGITARRRLGMNE